MPSSILFVHQGYELYGSDRTFIQSVQVAATRWPEARITVLLPRDGELHSALLGIVGDVRVVDLAILRKRDLKRSPLRFLAGVARKTRAARRMMRGYDVTYINTVTVLDYIGAACITRGKRVVHVHEIPTGLAAVFFCGLLVASRAWLVFNSSATRRRFVLPVWQRRFIVWNGVGSPPARETSRPHPDLNLLVIGRFNGWKGQEILLRAVASLAPELRVRVRVRLVGGVFGEQEHFSRRLIDTISELNLAEIAVIFPFTADPWAHYNWADVVVVPSTKPEPFGLVAIEGMAAGCSVIAANHGGLAEIVIDGVTGTLVEPGSTPALAGAIEMYIQKPERALAEGKAGQRRFAETFEERHYKEKIGSILAEMGDSRATR